MNKFIARIKDSLSFRYRCEVLRKIRLIPNVSIGENFELGENSRITIVGKRCRKFQVLNDVKVKMFCNFLLYQDATFIVHENVFFNNYCSVNCLGNIEIGTNTLFGEGVKIYDHNHHYQFLESGDLIVEREKFNIGEVKIGKNCWIGSNVTILNNVEIGDNVIIGANCLIYKSIPSNTIVKLKSEYVMEVNEKG